MRPVSKAVNDKGLLACCSVLVKVEQLLRVTRQSAIASQATRFYLQNAADDSSDLNTSF